MERDDTLDARLGQIGSVPLDQAPGLTIRPRALVAATAKRALPDISIELRATSDTSPIEGVGPGVGRDLEVLRTLGEGGMARVFLARQHSLGREVAVKTIRENATEVERSALLSEGAITGHLEHPGVIPVHALGVDPGGRPALVMKWVEGASWSERIADKEVPLETHLEILMQVCNAVHFAHSRGVIHRDIKPDNVLLGRYGEVYLADWGIALRTDAQESAQPLCGTPSYMAPEMAMSGRIDERTDVFLLGATLHRLLAGNSRHQATNIYATLMLASKSLPVEYPSSVPAPLAALANMATSVNPDDRPATAVVFRQSLVDYLRHKGSIALAASALSRIGKLRALVEASPAHAEVDILAAEARFAVEEARRAWPENPEAARANDELEALLETRRKRTTELEALAREHDPGVSHRQRMVGLAVVAAVALLLSISAFVTDRRDLDTAALLRESLVVFVIITALVGGLRRSLFANELNRRASVFVMLSVTGILAHRVLGWLGGASAPQLLATDCLIFALSCTAGAIAVFRWLIVPAAIMIFAGFWAAVAPHDATRAFAAGIGAAHLSMVFFAARRAP